MTLNKTIAALIPDWPVLPGTARTELIGDCAAFVRTQVGLAPFYVRLGFWVLYGAFCFYAFLRVGPFAGPVARGIALTGFSALPLPLVAALERLLRASTLLAFFDHPVVLAALQEPSPAMRQQSFRALRASQMQASP
ncbi:MAG TPA: hypothetical protein VJ750_13675 [Rhizomicrobium sp.]|nr:hypothetical protein [Rhizomicrobium sp.]